MIDQTGETSFQLNHGRTARDTIGPGIHNRARLTRAFLRTVLVAAGANFVVALHASARRSAGRAKIAQDFFGDNADNLFDFALIHGFEFPSSPHSSRTRDGFLYSAIH
jgi:hypothetical protein